MLFPADLRPENWALCFTAENSPALQLLLRCGSKTILEVARDEMLHVTLHTHWNVSTKRFGDTPDFAFTLSSPVCCGDVRIVWRGYSARLYVNGALMDEDWPLGELPAGDWIAEELCGIHSLAMTGDTPDAEDPEVSFTRPFQHFVLPGHNTGVGDCMPFQRDGRFCLYYLLDRRGHGSKKGLGAHQWAQVSTTDLRTWTIHPMAVPITAQWEGSICTGSLIQKDGMTYAYYAARMSDGTPARLTCAVSADGVHFRKTTRSFALTAPYEPVSARDPMVFLDADGLYHMLVTTSLTTGEGCLAHLTSPDLNEWTQHGPFIVPGYSDQPECSDYFYWNGWYYLVFSNHAIARYRMSRQPFGPWLRPKTDLLDAPDVHVPKTAAFGGRRLSCGFLSHTPRGYAGHTITHELFQRADGTLGVKPVEEILFPAAATHSLPDVQLDVSAGSAHAELPPVNGPFRLQGTLTTSADMLCGLTLTVGGERWRVELDTAAGTAMVIRPGEASMEGHGRDLLRCVPLTGEVPFDLTAAGSIAELFLGDGYCLTWRLNTPVQAGDGAAFFAQSGAMRVTALRLHDLNGTK